MFRLATRSITGTLRSSLFSKPAFTSNSLRFYSSQGLSKEEITRRIAEANAYLINSKPITAETSLEKDLGLDSLDGTEFVVNVENEFDLQFTDEDSEKVRTIGHIVDLVAANPQAN